MKFVQIIEFETERLEEMQQVLDEAGQRNAGRAGGPTHSTLLKDRDKPHRYPALIEFESFGEAMRNSDDPRRPGWPSGSTRSASASGRTPTATSWTCVTSSSPTKDPRGPGPTGVRGPCGSATIPA
ncbi:hypothetical protein ACIBQ5_08580 [Streptomyces massasporeus]|uniref:hypothetical protein n=1 Tax=Streptomyces massasporeus TaxID=67324 RepID=UPI0037A8B782